MFWKRPSASAGFYGMVAGVSGAFLEYFLYRLHVLHFSTPMASNTWNAVWGLVPGLIVMLMVTALTDPPSEEKLKGLVYSYAAHTKTSDRWYQSPEFYALVVLAMFIYLNVKFF